MNKREALAKVVESDSPKAEDRIHRCVFWELRHARLRLAIAENELAWAQEALVHGYISATAALQILDTTMDDISGARP